MSTIGEKFKEVRKYMGKNQKNFAEELGISQNHISSIENGKDNPSVSLQKLMCTKFNISEEWLKNDIGGMQPGYNTFTDEGLLSKYNEVKFNLECMLKSRSGKELKYTVMAVNYLVGMLSYSRIEETYREDYLASLCKCIDEMEKFGFRTCTILNYGKKDYQHFLDYRNSAEKHITTIEHCIREMNNVILRQNSVDNLIEL